MPASSAASTSCARDAFLAADQFDDDIGIGSCQIDWIDDPRKCGYVCGARFLPVSRRHRHNLELALGALGQIAAARMQRLEHAAADGAETCNRDAQRCFHKFVMAGLVPAIQEDTCRVEDMDDRHKTGHDDNIGSMPTGL